MAASSVITIPDAVRLARLQPPQGVVRVVMDTDTYNEVDDQFAIVYALLSPERIALEAVYAAPFDNDRSTGAADGMERSYQEILRLFDKMGRSPNGKVFRGSPGFLGADKQPYQSDAVADLIARAMSTPKDAPLYVLAIAAITNVASAILIQPEIIEHIVVVWIGGHALHWHDTQEFNLRQDVAAARVLFDSGVPLIHIPALNVTSHLQTTIAELEQYVRGRGAIGDYLIDIVRDYAKEKYAWSKIIWDIAAVAYVLNDQWMSTELVHSPIVTDQVTWSVDHRRHFVRYVSHIQRDPIFRDLFQKLESFSKG
jgi:inosine-uridine nucleoside N-ribohydrolase